MRFKIGFILEQLKDWFPKAQAKFKAQAAELESKVSQRNLSPLPQSQITTLSNRIEDLITPLPYRTLIQSKLTEVITQWQKDEDAPNSLVVLGSPLEVLGKIMNETLTEWEQHDLWEIKSLSWSTRRPNPSGIKTRLLEEIGSSQDLNLPQDKHESQPLLTESSEKHQLLLLIPDLSKCFLRCVDGLEGIEYLQDLLLQDRSRFWLIGCNDWAWEYLNVVCQFSAYCEQTISLPAIDDIKLKNWLTPVSETIQFEFSDFQDYLSDNLHMESDSEDNWISASEQSYFKYLAQISLGVSNVAAKLWLNSLGIEHKEENSSQEDTSEAEDNLSTKIVLKWSRLPDLPELTKDDRYLLFSLCLHGEMTLCELALSLGESQNKVQNQIQTLRNSGVIEVRNGFIGINPTHYPRLKRNLANNHFLITGDR